MGCQKKERGEPCGHHQCPFSSETSHGYECVDILFSIVDGSNHAFCEAGEGCLSKCTYSFNKGDGSLAARAAEEWNKQENLLIERMKNEQMIEDLLKYTDHLPTCTMRQDWSEAEDAFANTPSYMRGPDFDEAVSEMNRKKNTCSCGLHELVAKINH